MLTTCVLIDQLPKNEGQITNNKRHITNININLLLQFVTNKESCLDFWKDIKKAQWLFQQVFSSL